MLNVFPSAEEYNTFQNELMAAKEIEADNVVVYEFLHRYPHPASGIRWKGKDTKLYTSPLDTIRLVSKL